MPWKSRRSELLASIITGRQDLDSPRDEVVSDDLVVGGIRIALRLHLKTDSALCTKAERLPRLFFQGTRQRRCSDGTPNGQTGEYRYLPKRNPSGKAQRQVFSATGYSCSLWQAPLTAGVNPVAEERHALQRVREVLDAARRAEAKSRSSLRGIAAAVMAKLAVHPGHIGPIP